MVSPPGSERAPTPDTSYSPTTKKTSKSSDCKGPVEHGPQDEGNRSE